MASLLGPPCRAARASLLLAALAGGIGALADAHAQATPLAQGAEARVRLVRSTSGSRGVAEGGRYLIEDPRTVFSAADDRQVVVYFEWEGRPGTYRCEGRWKDPTGKVVLVAPIEYRAASSRFGLYWTLALPATAANGLWALEVYADGQPAGTHTFEVVASAAPPPGRRLLSPAEIYQRALVSVAIVESRGGAGEMLGQGPAVALDGDHLATAFPSIEGATTVRLRTALGERAETQEISGWNRRQGWAVIELPGHGLSPLPRAAAFPAVGERCYVLDTAEDGGRVIAEASIVGQEPSPLARPRLNSWFAAGSPVLDERGDLVGMVAAAEDTLGPRGLILAASGVVRAAGGTLVVPVDRLPTTPAARVSLGELAARGEFLRPLSADQRHVISGVFAGRVQRGGVVPMPQDQRTAFSRREEQVSVFVQWNPVEKKDVLSRFEVYDADYRAVMKGESSKLKLRPGELFFSTWTFPIGRLAPAVYRVDLLLGEAPIWRGYLRITE